MTHGDDSGLILPPRVAPYQVVIVPIQRGQLAGDRAAARAGDPRGARAARRARHARRSRRLHARLEVLRVGDAGCSAAPGDRSEGHREVAGPPRAARHARESRGRDGRAHGPRHRAADRDPGRPLRAGGQFRDEHTTRAGPTRSSRRLWKGGRGSSSRWCGGADCEAEIKAETQATLRNIPFGSDGIAGRASSAGNRRPERPGSRRPINRMLRLRQRQPLRCRGCESSSGRNRSRSISGLGSLGNSHGFQTGDPPAARAAPIQQGIARSRAGLILWRWRLAST